MQVIVDPGTHSEERRELNGVMWETFCRHQGAPKVLALLIEMLVEKGVLTLADCQALGAPHMGVPGEVCP